MRARYLDDETPIDPALLARQGVYYEALDPATDPTPALVALMTARGYVERDEVAMSPATPDLAALAAKFVDEHLHDDDEVRFVLEGAGVFDIRDGGDRWMRVEVYPGDLIVVPAGRHHRFMLTDEKRIRCVRLFKDRSGWIPRYRGARNAG